MADNSSYCRSCMVDNPKNFVNMGELQTTGDNHERITLLDMFYQVTDIRTEKDNFSRILCKPCASTLKFSYDFRRQSQLTQSMLIQKANQLTTIMFDVSNDSSPVKSEVIEYAQVLPEVEEGVFLEVENLTKSEVIEEPEYFEQEYVSDDDKTENTEEDIRDGTAEATKDGQDKVKKSARPRSDWRGYFCISYSCRKLFKSSKEMRNHLNANKGFTDHMFECDICKKKVEHKEGIRSHINQFHMEIRCDECSEYLSGRYWYYTHLRKIHGKKTNEKAECPVCKKTYRGKLNMQRHRRMIHEGKVPQKYPCSICGKLSFSKMNLKVHMRVHTDERPYSCELCGRAFKQQTTLRVHLASHATEKNFECNICGIKIKTEHYLKEHRKLHNNSEQYPCEKCGIIFKRLSYLRSHSTVHEEVGTVEQCRVCYKNFKSKKTLRDHMRYHEEPKFFCERCDKAFIRSDLLREHMIATHEMLRRWICQFQNCNKAYFRSSHLRHHEKVVHKNKSQKLLTKNQQLEQQRQQEIESANDEVNKVEHLDEAEEDMQ